MIDELVLEIYRKLISVQFRIFIKQYKYSELHDNKFSEYLFSNNILNKRLGFNKGHIHWITISLSPFHP